MKSTTQSKFTPAIDKLLTAYAAVAVAALAGPAASNVEATVITNSTPIPVPADIDGVYINFLTGATGTAAFTGWDVNAYLTNSVFTFFWPSATTGGGVDQGGAVYASLSPGSVISAASVFTANSGGGGAGSTINFQSLGEHILGFRFLNEATGVVNYGYAVISNGATAGFPATILSYSYEDNGGAITVAAVPEPSTFTLLGLVALGAFGVRQWRLRKAA